MPYFSFMWWRRNLFLLSGVLLLLHSEAAGGLEATSGESEAAVTSSLFGFTATESSTPDFSEDVVFQTIYACQDERLQISCLDGYTINIVRANYGRFSIAVCNEVGRTDFSVNCMSKGSLNVLKSRCDGNVNCVAWANSTDFPTSVDPCPSTVKYLEAQFYCSKRQKPHITSSYTRPAPIAAATPDLTLTSTLGQKSSTRRIPITPKPTVTNVFTTTTVDNQKEKVKAPSTRKVSEITSKFLSSSISSTNIMDTSDLPVTLEVTTSTTTSSTTTTSTTSTASIVSSSTEIRKPLQETIFVAPSLPYLESNKPYPIIPFTTSTTQEQPQKSSGTGSLKCPPLMRGGLQWNWTVAGNIATRDCGPTAAGLAYWSCNHEGRWMTGLPDLSQCQSHWLQKLRGQLDRGANRQASIVHVAHDLAHYTSNFGPLLPGDLLLLIDTVESMTSRMRDDLRTIPTLDQKRAVITQVVQDILRTISLSVSEETNGLAWERLGGAAKKRKCVTLMISALENAGLLLPEVIHENKEVTVASPNILMSVKGVNFGHMSKLRLPSEAATASENWANFTNRVEIPSLDLMEHMQQGGDAQILFLSFKSLHALLPPPQDNQDKDLRIISNIVSVTMGERYSKYMGGGVHPTKEVGLNDPLHIAFVHHSILAAPTCAYWSEDDHRWSTKGCKLLYFNGTHSDCGCHRLATFALLASSTDAAQQMQNSVSHDILVGVMAAVILVLSLLIIGVVALFFRRRKVLLPRPRQYCCQPLKLMCNGLLQSIKNYFCCHLKRGRGAGGLGKHHHYPEASARSTSSFAPSQLFSDRIYELHDNSGSVMTTPTFVTQPPNRNEDFFAARNQPQVDYQQQWHHHTQRKEPSRKGLSLDLPKNLWPSRDIVATPERPLLTDLPSPDYSYNGAISNNIYHEIPDDLQPIHRPIQLAVAGNTAGIQSCNTSSSSSGYGSVLRYDNVRGDSRGPFISYPVLEDRPLQPLALSRPNNLALEKQAHDSPLI